VSGTSNDARRTKLERPAAASLRYDAHSAGADAALPSSPGAERIIAIAREHGLALHDDPGLIDALARLEIGASLPRELCAVIAEAVAFVYALDAEHEPLP
jgi:flagellar biosynthesis protein